jgi:small-conductance mechanosensitive channel
MEELVKNFNEEMNPYLLLLIIFVISGIAGIIIRFLFFKVINYLTSKEDRIILKSLEQRFKGSIFLFIPLIIVLLFIDYVDIPQEQIDTATKWLEILIILSITVIVIRFIYFVQDVLFKQYAIDKPDNIRERQVRTQITFLRKIVILVVVVLAISVVLFQFEGARKYGATLLTSAGVAGIIIGFAAQKTISNLLAGFQIAFTQPIKIDDAVIVENEWGWIEEINLTYVVVRIWDMRRLVVPITYFTEKSFQNWTRNSADIMGSVFLYTDYTIPVDKLRTAFEVFLAETEMWDKKAQVLQVVECTEKSMQLRLLMTAKNSPTAWDLRCFIREKMITYIQEHYPEALPKTRVILHQKEESIKKPD